MTQHRDPECLFCRIIAGELPSDVVYQDDELMAFKDISPAAPFHVLIVPKVHLATLNEFDAEHAALLGRIMLTAKQLAAAAELSGYRVVMNVDKEGGQVVFHAHLHVLGGRQMRALG